MDLKQLPVKVTVRDGGVETDPDFCYHLECRFADGQKFAAVKVDGCYPELAHLISTMLNETANQVAKGLKEQQNFVKACDGN